MYMFTLRVFTEHKASTDPDSQSGAKQPATAIVHNPPADPGSLKEQLLDDNLLHLWRTGANYEQYRPEEDWSLQLQKWMPRSEVHLPENRVTLHIKMSSGYIMFKLPTITITNKKKQRTAHQYHHQQKNQ